MNHLRHMIIRLAEEYGTVGSAMVLVSIGLGMGIVFVASAWCCIQSRADINAAKVEMMEDYIAKMLVERRITAAEREALERAANHLDNSGWSSMQLRQLLERLG